MRTASVNNSPNFGHSFRVSICLKGENCLENIFVNPATNEKLYKTLNSKIVSWLNEDFYNSLRKTYGVQRKTSKVQPENSVHKQLIQHLKILDRDYAGFGLTRSVYRRNALAYIATGSDVSIIENIKGAKYVGTAKADAARTGFNQTDYIRALVGAVKNNIINYVSSDNVLLRSKNDKEIMLRAIFKKLGADKYELDSFEFHENVSKPTLKQINPNFARYKESSDVSREIRNTINYHVNKLFRNKKHYSDWT